MCIQSYRDGGFKFLDLKHYISALKSTWIRRFLTGEGRWKIIFESNFNSNTLLNTGKKYIDICINKTSNIFWKDTFESWKSIINSQEQKSNTSTADFLVEPLWYNDLFKIDSKVIYYKKIFENGVLFVKHLINNENGDYHTYDEFKQIYDINCNFLSYYSLICTVKSNQTINTFENLENCIFPNLPSTVSLFYKNTKGAKEMYTYYPHNNNNSRLQLVKLNGKINSKL